MLAWFFLSIRHTLFRFAEGSFQQADTWMYTDTAGLVTLLIVALTGLTYVYRLGLSPVMHLPSPVSL